MANCCIERHLNEPGKIWCAQCGSLVEGAVIDDYRVLSYLGSGSSSDVYLAEQTSLNQRRVVIKILHRSCQERHVGNFQREAALLASLSHPYILPIFSYGVLYERRSSSTYAPYLVLPYADQGTVADAFAREGRRPWSLARVVSLARDVAEALDYAHSRRVLHRDVKPANLLQMGAHVLLSDFSVASLIEAEASHLSVPWAGSPAYMAPEVWQLRPGRYSDQYALAISCFFLLAADFPWAKSADGRARSQRVWSTLHCYVAPRSILELRPDLPEAVNVVLQRALAKDPHQRYPTVQEFAADLFAASQDITQSLAKPSKGTEISVIAWEPNRLPAVLAQPALPLPPTYHRRDDAPARPVPPVATDPVRATPLAQSSLDQVKEGTAQVGEISTDPLRSSQRDKWTWGALLLTLLVCLTLAAEYTWQAGDVRAAATLLLAIWPALLIGPLLARLFRRVTGATLSWGLFWGVFFGLTDGLLSALACCTWIVLAQLPGQWQCPSWCQPGDGITIVRQEIITLVPQALIPFIMGLWMVTIGGAVIGIIHIRRHSA